MASFGRDVLGNLPHASRLEWLITNGIGGYAASTIAGVNTRRYHGILVASRRPPVERIVMVSRIEETLTIGGQEFPLSTSHSRKAVDPAGFIHLELFDTEPIPTWVYQIQDVLVIKSLCMIHGQNSTLVTYKILSNRPDLELRLRPHFLFRDFQSRNIMIKDNEPYFIDYQSGRRGALQYDLASLLYDAKANIPQDIREKLIEEYIFQVKKYINLDQKKFKKYFYGFALIRIMQALGAYGFLGSVKNKPHFLGNIPFAVANLEIISDKFSYLNDLPELKNIIFNLCFASAYKNGKIYL